MAAAAGSRAAYNLLTSEVEYGKKSESKMQAMPARGR